MEVASTERVVNADQRRARENKRVLVVDDDPEVCDALRGLLGFLGFEVDCAAEGKAALEKLDGRRFDLALVDVVLPGGIDGIKVGEVCRSLEMPVVMMTGAIVLEEKLSGLSLSYPLLRKPFNLVALSGAITIALGE